MADHDDHDHDERPGGDAADAFRRLDAPELSRSGGPDDEGPRPSAWARLRRQAMWLLVAAVGMLAVGFLGGWLFGRGASPTASRLVLSELVEMEPDARADGELPPGADVAPTSGETDEEPVCGVADGPVDPERQVATLAAGGVVVQYRPGDVSSEGLGELRALAAEVDSHVLVAPNLDLRSPVEATAWRVRLRLDEVEDVTLALFVDGYRRPDPAGGACPT